MATLTTQNMTRAGMTISTVAAAGGGDFFLPSGQTFFYITNAAGSQMTVTFDTPGSVVGLAIANVAVVVPASSNLMIGPFPYEFFANPVDGLCSVTYSSVTTVSVIPIVLTQP